MSFSSTAVQPATSISDLVKVVTYRSVGVQTTNLRTTTGTTLHPLSSAYSVIKKRSPSGTTKRPQAPKSPARSQAPPPRRNSSKPPTYAQYLQHLRPLRRQGAFYGLPMAIELGYTKA